MADGMTRTAERVKSWAAAARRLTLDAVFPPVCPITDEPVAAPGQVSPAAWASLGFVDEPWCVRCGAPFPFSPGGDTECAACVARPPSFDRARAALVYDEASKKLILALKHGARTDAVATMAGWLARLGADGLARADALLPVPLHPSRLRQRRFNQSTLIARALAASAGVPADADVLFRRRRTGSQEGRSARGRARNVAGAFAVRPAARDRVEGKTLILVDDVLTTGATLDACAKALKRAGASRVEALAVARVVRARDVTI